MRSLEGRLTLGLAGALLIVFGLLLWGAVGAVRSLSEANLLTRLEHDAEALLGAFWRNPQGQPRMREGRLTPIYQQPLSGHYFVVALDDGREIRSRSLWDETLAVTRLALGEVRSYELAGPREQRLKVRSAGYHKLGLGFTLLVAEDLAPLEQQIQRFQGLALLVMGLALLLILLAQRLLLRRAFHSLDRVRDELQAVSGGRQAQLRTLGPAEIQPLTVELNRLLERLQRRLERSRLALGNLAHALKAPLTLITREIDGLAAPSDTRTRLSEYVGRIGGLIDRELKRARFASQGGGQHFVARDQVPELLDALRRIYRDRALDIRAPELPEGSLPFDRDDMLELLGNLLDNACKWADRRVELTIRLSDQLEVCVADDGRGVAEADRTALLRRGGRLDEQTSGHGLGLAIVNDLVSDYGGRIDLGRAADLGGLQVTIRLPLPVGSED